MKTLIRLVVLAITPACLALAETSATNPARGTGVGVIVGDPTGLSIKHWLGPTRAIDAAAAWSFSGRDSFHVHTDYLWHDFDSLKAEKGRLAWYYGLGARAVIVEDEGPGDNNDDTFGVRVPFGLDYFFEKSPCDIFVEVAPVLEVAPDSEFTADIGFGARYYFR